MSGAVLGATVLAVVSAFLYGLSNLLELLEAEQVADEYALRVGLLSRLVRRPRWLLGMLCDLVGFATHAAALALAAVVFVEPIIASAIAIALFLGATFTHRAVHRLDWIAAAVLTGGLALFLYEMSPTAGRSVVPARPWLVAGPIVVATMVVFVVLGRASSGARRGALLGVAAGTAFGVTAVLTKAFVHYLGAGVFAWVPHWEPYALVVAALGGLVVAQSALQTGALGAAVGATESMTPVAAVILGLTLLHERVTAHGALHFAAIAVAVGAIVAGIAMLSRAEQRLADELAHPEPA